MLSRILASATALTPSTKLTGPIPKCRSRRPAVSARVLVRITSRMWSTSRWPRLATTSWRRASSSRPKASASARVRVLLGSVGVMGKTPLQAQLEVGARNGDAELDVLVGLARDDAGDQVQDGAARL